MNFTFGNSLSQIIDFSTKFNPFWPCIKAEDKSTEGSYDVKSDIFERIDIVLGVLTIEDKKVDCKYMLNIF